MHRADRLHALDFLRAFAMFLGIALHGVLAYTDKSVPFWPVHDAERSPIADVSVYTIHLFRMQTFFLLAGFFGCLLYQRYRLGGIAAHRFKRIVIPLILAVVLVQPILQAIWLIGRPSALPYVGLPVPPAGSDLGGFVLGHFTSGEFLGGIRPYHLWFLYYLTLVFVVALPVLWIARKLEGSRLAWRIDMGFRWLTVRPDKALWLALPLVPLMWRSRYWSVDTPESWPIHFDVLAYYGVFFAVGWMLYRHRDLLSGFTRHWVVALVGANVLVLPIMLAAVTMGLLQPDPGSSIHAILALKFVALYMGALYSWLMVVGLMGAFQHWFSGERRWVRYLSDSAYWCYIVHLIPVVLLQMALASTSLPGFIKFLIVVAGTFAVLLLSYEYLVRYTIIGTILNGPKVRTA